MRYEPLFPARGTPDAGKAAHRIAVVEIALTHLLDDGAEEAGLSLETRLIFYQELVKAMKKAPGRARCAPDDGDDTLLPQQGIIHQETGQSHGYGRLSLHIREEREFSKKNQAEKTPTDVDSYIFTHNPQSP